MSKYRISFRAMKRHTVLLAVLIVLASCKPETYIPKPRGYYKVDLPETHTYQSFDSTGFPYKFEYPTYGEIVTNPDFFGDKPENPYWINIEFPKIGGRIYLSYKNIDAKQSLSSLNNDMYEMTFSAHTKKANYIKDYQMSDPSRNVHIMLYNVTGNAASAYQFYATDSARNFIRGALYFEVTPNADSLKPLNNFLREDIEHLLETLEWK